MTRGPRRPAIALLAALLCAAWSPAQANQGVIISEVVHGPSLPGGLPRYIELVNVQIANPVVPPPVPIGAAGAGAATVTANVANQPPLTFSIPIGIQLGGNVQPPPAPQPPVPPANPPVMLLSSGPFPTGVVPAGVPVIVAPSLFSGPNTFLGAPGIPFEICFHNPATGSSDRIHLGPATAVGCTGAPFTNTGTFATTTGKAIRWVYMDSDTDIDFDPGFAISPGAVNPQMTHVNGLFFGTTTSPPLGGTPLLLTGTTTSGSLTAGATALVKSVHFVNAFLDRTISHPAFDPIINAQLSLTMNFTAQNPSVAQPNFLPGLSIFNEVMTISAATPAGTAVLQATTNVGTLVGQNIGPSAASGTDIRPERIYSDLVSDSTWFVAGSPTAAMIDVIPPSTGGGNTWCEVIVYDYQGNQYRAKVKNWPPGGQCNGPVLGLGTDGLGSGTLINLCFNPNAMVANVFSQSPAGSCGGPLFPPGGVCPDALTAWILSPPQLGAPPFFVTTDSGGIYLFQVPSPTLIALIGQTFEGIAVEYTLAPAIVQQSTVTSITF